MKSYEFVNASDEEKDRVLGLAQIALSAILEAGKNPKYATASIPEVVSALARAYVTFVESAPLPLDVALLIVERSWSTRVVADRSSAD